MKISFPRHIVYSIIGAILLVIFAIWFAVAKLIPMGKEYRLNNITLKKEQANLEHYQEFYNKTLQVYNDTKRKNRHIIQAFDNPFDPNKFIKLYQKYFISLSISKPKQNPSEKWYEIYEINTTSKIKSPKNFYDFLDAINKSQWIMSVTFPIDFQRDGELLHSSFAMKVYKNKQEENNSTK